MNQQEAKQHGISNGLGAIKYCEVGDNDIREAGCGHGHLELCEDCLTSAAYDAEMRGRDFSPFEFLAYAMNEDENRSDGLWAAYEEGVRIGIRRGMRDRLKSERDYS